MRQNGIDIRPSFSARVIFLVHIHHGIILFCFSPPKDTKFEELQKWWAQYLESNEDYEGAINFYERGKDYVNMVRVLCLMDRNEDAEKVIEATNHSGAAYHLAGHFEEKGEIKKAVEMYKLSKMYHHALRLARDNGLDELMSSIALEIPDTFFTERTNPKETAAR